MILTKHRLIKICRIFLDTDIDWVDLADDIRHEYYVVDNLRPSHGYKFRILARNKFGWSIPSIPSGIVMTPSSGASKAEFYDALQTLQVGKQTWILWPLYTFCFTGAISRLRSRLTAQKVFLIAIRFFFLLGQRRYQLGRRRSSSFLRMREKAFEIEY